MPNSFYTSAEQLIFIYMTIHRDSSRRDFTHITKYYWIAKSDSWQCSVFIINWRIVRRQIVVYLNKPKRVLSSLCNISVINKCRLFWAAQCFICHKSLQCTPLLYEPIAWYLSPIIERNSAPRTAALAFSLSRSAIVAPRLVVLARTTAVSRM